MKKGALTAGAFALVAMMGSVSTPAQTGKPFPGEIMQFGGTFCPIG
jgi:hypothetical protein